MQLNPTLAKLLEAYELEELNTLVGWLEPDAKPLADESPLLKEESIMNTTICSTPIVLDDLVEFSILNEFGPNFQGKSCFSWLRQCLIQRFNPNRSI